MKPAVPVVATTIVQVLTSIAALTVPSLVPLVANDPRFHAIGVGTFISILYAAAATVTLFAGHLVGRAGAIRTCQFAVACCCIGLLCASTGSTPGLVVGAIALGMGYGPITPASSHLLANAVSASNRRFIFSLKQTGVPAGTALAGALVPAVTVLLGWRWALALVAISCLAVVAALQTVRRELDLPVEGTYSRSPTPVLSSVTMVLNHPYLRLLALAAFVLGGAQMCASTFLISYFYKGLDYTALAAGAMLTIANVAGVIFRLVWGAAADRGVNPRQLLAGLAVLTSVSVAVMASQTLMTHHMAAAIACFVLGSTAIGWNGVLLAEVAEAAPASAVSTATAGCMFFSFGGVMTFPVLFGFIQRATGSYFASWMATAGAAALLGITLYLSKCKADQEQAVVRG